MVGLGWSFGSKVGSRGYNPRCPGQGECTGRFWEQGRQGLRTSATRAILEPPGRGRGLLPHLSHLQRKTWGPDAAASGCICRSPARRRARPGGGAGSAPPPCCLPPPSHLFLRPRAPSFFLLHPSPTRFVGPACCDWLGGSAAPAPRGRRGHKPRLPPKAAEGTEIGGPEAALHLDQARGAACAPPSEGRGAWPHGRVEEVRASRGHAAGPLLERRRQGGPQPLPPPPLPSPLQPSGGPETARPYREGFWAGLARAKEGVNLRN